MSTHSREYINGMLAGLNVALIYVNDGKITPMDIQSEIDAVLQMPVKADEPIKPNELEKLELKEKEFMLSKINEQMARAIKLSDELKNTLLYLPIYPHIKGETLSTINGD